MDVQVQSLGGEYMDEATVVQVLVQAGTAVAAGEPVVVLETAKAQAEVVAPAAGTVERVCVRVDDEVSVGQTLIVLAPA